MKTLDLTSRDFSASDVARRATLVAALAYAAHTVHAGPRLARDYIAALPADFPNL